jgi:hypothetical protein
MLFDEIELSFHPNWQKRLLKSFIHIQDELSKSKRLHLHLIFTSHSPFILSDLPKENIIFLNKYKEDDIEVKNGNQKIGNCKNVTKETNIETFGANIHILLSHGFFMSDGLMGEFAKGKINEVIKLLNSQRKLSKKSQKFCENIISIIGEPILQKTLRHQLNEKLNSNETELQRLERQQKEIKDKIDKLKGR